MASFKQRIFAAIEPMLVRLMLPCRDITRLASQAMDRKLGWFSRIRLWFHCRLCRLCRRYRDQLRLMRRSISLLGGQGAEAGPALPAELRERIEKGLREQGGN